MTYSCELCSFNGRCLNDLRRHLETKKHKAAEKPIQCNCGKKFASKTNLLKHKKYCKNHAICKPNNITKKEPDVIVESDIIERQINIIEKHIVEKQINIVEKRTNTTTYICTHFGDAPDLQPFTNFKDYIGDVNVLSDEIVHNFRHKKLAQFIGNMIIKEYKKENPKEQSVWNTDYSRFVYIIKQSLNNISGWHIDKGGIHFFELLIRPILSYIKEMLQHETVQISRELPNVSDIMEAMDKIKTISEIIVDINDGILSKEIIKHCSGYFHFQNPLTTKVIECGCRSDNLVPNITQ